MSLLQNIFCFIGLFCKRDIQFEGKRDLQKRPTIPTNCSHPVPMKYMIPVLYCYHLVCMCVGECVSSGDDDACAERASRRE